MRQSATLESVPRNAPSGTEHAAEEPRDDDVHAHEEDQQETDDPRAGVEVLVRRKRSTGQARLIIGRMATVMERWNRQMGSSQPICRVPQDGRHDHGDEDDVFERIQLLVAVGLDAFAFLGPAFAQQPAGEVVQDAVGTDPVAEDAPEQQRRHDEQQAPEQPM